MAVAYFYRKNWSQILAKRTQQYSSVENEEALPLCSFREISFSEICLLWPPWTGKVKSKKTKFIGYLLLCSWTRLSGQKAVTAFTFIQGQTTAVVRESCCYQTSFAATGLFLICFSEAAVIMIWCKGSLKKIGNFPQWLYVGPFYTFKNVWK